MRPFHFAVLFWGERYREHYFLGLFLPSLLSPNNLPLLKAGDGHKLIVATTRDDWQELLGHPVIERLRRHVNVQWVEIEEPTEIDDKLRTVAVRHQNIWFAKLLRETHDPRAYGSVHSPDTVVADGLVASMLKWAEGGHDCVILPVLRQAEEPLLAELRSTTITPREATRLAIKHLHQEIYPFIEPINRNITHAPFRLWRMPGGSMLLHTFFGLPVLMDYRVVSSTYREGIEMCLRTGNFANCKRVHIVADSDEATILSLTAKDEVNFFAWPAAKETIWRTAYNVRTAFKEFATDHVRRQAFLTPVRWHTEDVDFRWLEQERKVQNKLKFCTNDGVIARLLFDVPAWLGKLAAVNFFYHIGKSRKLRKVINLCQVMRSTA